jgi:hypothetical protein
MYPETIETMKQKKKKKSCPTALIDLFNAKPKGLVRDKPLLKVTKSDEKSNAYNFTTKKHKRNR